MKYLKLFGVRINNLNHESFKCELDRMIRGENKKAKIFKINAEFLKRALDDPSFVGLLNQSTVNLVDGRGVLWTAKYLSLPVCKNKILRTIQSVVQMIYSGILIVFHPKYIKKPIQEAIPGMEAFSLVLEAAVENKTEVFLFGASKKTNDLTARKLLIKYPDLKLAGHLDGYGYQRDSKINPVEEINKTKAKILIVALGSPKQERWIVDNIDKLKNVKIAVGEGGTFDRIAYEKHRAPKVINKIGLEWLWRLFANKNLTEGYNSRASRVWNSVPAYIFKVVRWKINNGSISK